MSESEKTTPDSFDPRFTQLYDTSRYSMGFNQRAVNDQVNLTTKQVVGITEVINDYDKRIYELEEAVKQLQKDARVIMNTKPDAPKQLTRPGKGKSDE